MDQDDIIYTYVGKQIRRLRRESMMTQEALAQKIGLTRTSVTNIEAARQRPPISMIYKIAELFKTDVGKLFPTSIKDAEFSLKTWEEEEGRKRWKRTALKLSLEESRSFLALAEASKSEDEGLLQVILGLWGAQNELVQKQLRKDYPFIIGKVEGMLID
ncbi:helix-turn-helix transcriptional regulator [Paenibacillus xylanexedens]|uniref:helix-turn-helix transcriptional regulator n=1 Tax=Paenibacillus xylanexedens TaxID=528191 RepID=UPI001C92BF0E|nr:helix-turn-helix transcriptional regulator [Paenibacillus xylanexedens]